MPTQVVKNQLSLFNWYDSQPGDDLGDLPDMTRLGNVTSAPEVLEADPFVSASRVL
jgi:hypothetical protein